MNKKKEEKIPPPAGYEPCLKLFRAEIQKLVSKYSSNAYGNLWEEDLREEANLALLRKIQQGEVTPDPVTGSLTVLEKMKVRSEMRHVVHLRAIPLQSPLSACAGTLDKYRRLRKEYLNRYPETVWGEITADDLMVALNLPYESARKVLILAQTEVRLDAPVKGEDGENTAYADFLADDSISHPTQNLEKYEFAARLGYELKKLPPVQREVLGRRFGLSSKEEESCAEIAASRGCSRQSVDEQCRAAISRLRLAFGVEEWRLAA